MIRYTTLLLFALAVFQVGCHLKKTGTEADLEKSKDVEESAIIEETPKEEQLVQLKVEPKFQLDRGTDTRLIAELQMPEEWLIGLTVESQTFDEEVRNVPISLDTKLNVDSLTKYLNLRFPYRRTDYGDVIMNIIEDIDDGRYQTLKQVDDAMNSTEEWRHQIRQRVGSLWAHDGQVPATAELVWALGCIDEEFRNQPPWDVRHETKTVIEELIDR